MSQYNTQRSDVFGSAHSPSRTQRLPRQGEMQRSPDRVQGARTERMSNESPTKYDIQFYQRKVNRLQTDMAALQDELSLTKFKLNKADDFQRKYDIAFKQNQNLNSQLDIKEQQNAKLQREIDQLARKNVQAQTSIKALQDRLQNQRRNVAQLRQRHEQVTTKVSSEGRNERANVEENFNRQIANLKEEFRARQQGLKRKISSLETQVNTRQIQEKALKFKLDSIRVQKNKEIDRLKELSTTLKQDLSNLNKDTDSRVVQTRQELFEQTESRIDGVRKLANDIQECLMQQIRNLNTALVTKNQQIEFILSSDRKYMEDNQQLQNGLKQHIKRLQDKIFVIQRENEIELFHTIDRLQNQYQENVNSMNDEFDRVRRSYQQEVEHLNQKIQYLQKENNILSQQNKRVQSEHKKLATDKQEAVKMLSQKIISLQSSKDIDLKNYTTSMREIEADAKSKLQDLHSAIQTKNTQFEILNAQLSLKNQEINSLIDQISKLRNQNREKMRNLQSKNALQQNTLNDLITSYKREIQQLRRRVHELQSEISDKQAQAQLKINLMRQDLESQKQANQMLKARNNFLVEWCQQLERDLKSERVSNVNILHDTNISRRETVQIREQVRVELEAIKDKEVEQIRNIFKLEKNRLESDLINKEQQLRDKKQELARLLAEYKKLQNKVGKPSKFSRGAEQEGKCKATLDAEILLTENIFNAINTQ